MKSTNYKNFELLCTFLATKGGFRDVSCTESEIRNMDWERIFELADRYLVLPALYLGLKRKGYLKFLDLEAQNFLETIYELNGERNQKLKEEALSVIRILNSQDIQPILLKGIAGLLTGLYKEDGERIIGDIDLLVDKSELAKVVELLIGHGYRCGDVEVCEQVSEGAFFMHEMTMVTESHFAIDLHVRPTGPSGKKAFISAQEAREGGGIIEVEGVHALLPSPFFRLMHNFYHAQHLDHSYYIYGRINLRQLIDWVRLWQQYGNKVNYSEIDNKVSLHRKSKSFSLYTLNAEKYLNLLKPENNKTGWFVKTLFHRQILQMKYPWFYGLNRFLTMFIKAAQLFSPERLCLEFGDLPMSKLVVLRITKLFDPEWYRYRARGFNGSWG
jgi:hypothetical protein